MYFDIDKLKQIPILNIAHYLGIRVRKNKAMCFKGHDRKTPSLSFSLQKNLWHCFGCGLGGNNITLVKECRGYSFKEAADWLTREFAVPQNLYYKRPFFTKHKETQITNEYIEVSRHVNIDFKVYKAFFSRCSLSKEGKRYLEQRGYSSNIINHFQIKDLVNIRGIEKWLLKNFNHTRLIESGLMVRRKGVTRLIWWDHTILFPFTERNRIIYIQGRRTLSGNPKYMGLSGIPKPLYNQDILQNLPSGSIVCICEGITDTLTATQTGLNAVGVLGALSFRNEWCGILNKFRVVIIPDNDSAGVKFEQKIRAAFLEKGHVVEAIKLPSGSDLTDLLKPGKNVSIK